MISLKRNNEISYKTVKICVFGVLSKSSWIDVKVDINSGGYLYDKAKKNIPEQKIISRLPEYQQSAWFGMSIKRSVRPATNWRKLWMEV